MEDCTIKFISEKLIHSGKMSFVGRFAKEPTDMEWNIKPESFSVRCSDWYFGLVYDQDNSKSLVCWSPNHSFAFRAYFKDWLKFAQPWFAFSIDQLPREVTEDPEQFTNRVLDRMDDYLAEDNTATVPDLELVTPPFDAWYMMTRLQYMMG